ncbi:hypothetical protein J2789_000147 [Variovorax paradoxus]|uniref:hypothetical protein n=1 Tax=Variovorax atrisoli TaxID=3394203 RepID=UPI00119B460A|nr:hypothetical protein [Variovorax paradoxus]MDR6517485.1 hypothetical protein [Variovorax paradoxus]
MHRHEPTEPPAFPGPAKPTPIADGIPNPFYARHAARLAELREEFAQGTSHGRNITAAEREWEGISKRSRAMLLFWAGYDVNSIAFAVERAWRELPPQERTAVGEAIRELQNDLRTVFALTL